MPKDLSAAWKIRHQRWLRFVQANIRAMNAGKAIRLGPSARPLEAPAVKAGEGPPIKVVVCSPHPDDEALVGALPLRLRRECGAEVTNLRHHLGKQSWPARPPSARTESGVRSAGFRSASRQPSLGF